jgi:hypothetical protein
MLDKKEVQRAIAIAAWAFVNSKKPLEFRDSYGNQRSLSVNGGSSNIRYSDPLNNKLIDTDLGPGRSIRIGETTNEISMRSLSSSYGNAYCQVSEPRDYSFTISGNRVTFDSSDWVEVG